MTTISLYFTLIILSVVICPAPDITCEKAVSIIKEGWTCPKDAKKLGSGASAVAYLVSNEKYPQAVLKIQDISERPKKLRAFKEATIVKACNSENIIKFFDAYQSGQLLYTVVQFGELGSLANYIDNVQKKRGNEFKNPATILKIIKGIAQGLKDMHAVKYCHADLKTDNIVLTKDLRPLIIDFDLSVKLDSVDCKRGSTTYMAPEVITGKCEITYGYGVDVWSLGIVAYEIVTVGAFPFDGITKDIIQSRIVAGAYTLAEGMDLTIAYLIANMLQNDPVKRFTPEKIIEVIEAYEANPDDKKIETTHLSTRAQMKKEDFVLKPKIVEAPIKTELKLKPSNAMIAEKLGHKGGPIKAMVDFTNPEQGQQVKQREKNVEIVLPELNTAQNGEYVDPYAPKKRKQPDSVDSDIKNLQFKKVESNGFTLTQKPYSKVENPKRQSEMNLDQNSLNLQLRKAPSAKLGEPVRGKIITEEEANTAIKEYGIGVVHVEKPQFGSSGTNQYNSKLDAKLREAKRAYINELMANNNRVEFNDYQVNYQNKKYKQNNMRRLSLIEDGRSHSWTLMLVYVLLSLGMAVPVSIWLVKRVTKRSPLPRLTTTNIEKEGEMPADVQLSVG